MDGSRPTTAVEDLLQSTDLLADLLEQREIEFEGEFDAAEFLRDTIPLVVERIVDEAAQNVYRDILADYLRNDPNNASKFRTHLEGLIDPEFDVYR